MKTVLKSFVLAAVAILAAAVRAETTWTVTSATSGATTTFTVTRDRSSTAETVLFRTVGLSAFAGQHFAATNGTLAFAAGESAKSVAVTERTPSVDAYKFQIGSTRSYRFEVLNTSGFLLAGAVREMTSGTAVPAASFSVQDFRVRDDFWAVTDDGFDQSPWTDEPLLTGDQLDVSWDYVQFVGAQLRMTFDFEMYEWDDGYQHVQVLFNKASDVFDDDASGTDPGVPNHASYLACFSHYEEGDWGKWDMTTKYYFPVTAVGDGEGANDPWYGSTTPWYGTLYTYRVGDLKIQRFNTGCRAPDGRLVAPVPLESVRLRFDASGNEEDDWYLRRVNLKLQAAEETAPKLVNSSGATVSLAASSAIAVSPGPYMRGNIVRISLPFSEIVTVPETAKLWTSWGELAYEAGSGSNVLTFGGAIGAAPGSQLSLLFILDGDVSDLSGNAFSKVVARDFYSRSVEPSSAIPLTADTETFPWDGAVFLVDADVENVHRLLVSGDVTLVLGAGTTLTLPKGIEVPEGSSLTIRGEGTLVANADGDNAAIGAIAYGAITIEGGTVIATGGSYGAGIGGSRISTGGGMIRILGGNVTATGGFCAAGIGAGGNATWHQRYAGDIVISGGTVVAAAGALCDAGIGGGNSGGAGGRVGNITITGGCVKANGCIGATEGTCDGIMLGWSRAGDRIEAGSFNAGNVSVVDGRPLTDGENVYEGALEAAQVSSLSGKTLRPYIPSYAAWADANGITGAWNETDASGIHNVFRYAFDKPTGAFANPPLLDIKIEGGNAVVKTPPVAITAGFTVAVVESSDVAGATVTATKPLNATGRAKFPMGSAASRFYRLSATEGDPELGGVQLWEGGPYWAECNVGATEPEEYGYYFWWGDTVGYERQGNAWVAADGSSSDFSFSSGNTPTYDKDNSALRTAGYIDATGNLTAAHDAATAHLGAPWRMPTSAEIDALLSNCTTTWITRNGVNGRLVTGKGAYADRSIFLPAAGYGYDSDLNFPGSYGRYWSSSPNSDNSSHAWYLSFSSGYFGWRSYGRSYGKPVRPVRGFAE